MVRSQDYMFAAACSTLAANYPEIAIHGKEFTPPPGKAGKVGSNKSKRRSRRNKHRNTGQSKMTKRERQALQTKKEGI